MDEDKYNAINQWSIQDYLSFGYLYLLLIGIVSDSIYYGMVGINIISYSTVLDVLLSPISNLAENLLFPSIIFVLPAALYWWLKLAKLLSDKSKKRKLSKNPDAQIKEDKLNSVPLRTLWVLVTALVIFSTYIGYGLGGAMSVRKSLESGNIKLTHTIDFQDGSSLSVRVIGNNSEYIFYIPENGKEVSVSPIKGAVKTIRTM